MTLNAGRNNLFHKHDCIIRLRSTFEELFCGIKLWSRVQNGLRPTFSLHEIDPSNMFHRKIMIVRVNCGNVKMRIFGALCPDIGLVIGHK